jgi:hypothetical protein
MRSSESAALRSGALPVVSGFLLKAESILIRASPFLWLYITKTLCFFVTALRPMTQPIGGFESTN